MCESGDLEVRWSCTSSKLCAQLLQQSDRQQRQLLLKTAGNKDIQAAKDEFDVTVSGSSWLTAGVLAADAHVLACFHVPRG
jgi:hypothetical protein